MKFPRGILVFSLLVLAVNGCGKDSNPASTGPAPLCASPSQSGVTTTGGGRLAMGSGFIYAEPVTISSSPTALSLSINLTELNPSTPVSGQFWVAIYDDNGANSPGNLLVAGNPQNVINGWNTVNVPNVILTATATTVYWLAVQTSSNTDFAPENASGNMGRYAYTWGTFPTTFPGALSPLSLNTEFYVSTCP
jgi:hypothetical protein